MKKHLLTILSAGLLFNSCENMQSSSSLLNPRDRHSILTPGDQAESEIDRTITQKIRQSLIEDSFLSARAKNIKIVTINGVVTLRGVVDSEAEKTAVDQRAKSIQGVRRVDNYIEIVRIENTAS